MRVVFEYTIIFSNVDYTLGGYNPWSVLNSCIFEFINYRITKKFMGKIEFLKNLFTYFSRKNIILVSRKIHEFCKIKKCLKKKEVF